MKHFLLFFLYITFTLTSFAQIQTKRISQKEYNLSKSLWTVYNERPVSIPFNTPTVQALRKRAAKHFSFEETNAIKNHTKEIWFTKCLFYEKDSSYCLLYINKKNNTRNAFIFSKEVKQPQRIENMHSLHHSQNGFWAYTKKGETVSIGFFYANPKESMWQHLGNFERYDITKQGTTFWGNDSALYSVARSKEDTTKHVHFRITLTRRLQNKLYKLYTLHPTSHAMLLNDFRMVDFVQADTAWTRGADFCDDYHRVCIRSEGKEQWMNGHKVYRLYETHDPKFSTQTPQGTTTLWIGINFGREWEDDENGLNGCFQHFPLVLVEQGTLYPIRIHAPQTEGWDPLLELDQQTGFGKVILSFHEKNGIYYLHAFRKYQDEGGSDIMYIIKREEDNRFYAHTVQRTEYTYIFYPYKGDLEEYQPK